MDSPSDQEHMVCPASVLSSTLALSLLRHASQPDESFVLSPFSLGSALAIVHDGAGGPTQNELTQLLLKGCTHEDVVKHYSTLTTTLLGQKGNNGVIVNVANRFFVDQKISLLPDYQKHVETEYKAEVDNIQFSQKNQAAATINKFVEDSTKGKIKDMIKADGISDDAVAMLINAVYFLGNWNLPFNQQNTFNKTFHGAKGDREEQFMSLNSKYFPANFEDPLVTALMMPYKDKSYNFFVLLPKEGVSLEKARNEIDGERLQNILNGTSSSYVDILLPRFKIESKLDGNSVLEKLGVTTMFSDHANLKKITTAHIKVSKVLHNAVIEVNERGTEATAATTIGFAPASMPMLIHMDHPFVYGIIANANVLFIGQYA